ncbi:MAG: hypothetical protein AAF098_00935 [Pseudomonadota bacterium]
MENTLSEGGTLNVDFSGMIPNPNEPSYLPDIEFTPDGELFAITARDDHRVRLYRTRTRELVREFGAEGPALDMPHGLALSNSYLVVSSKGTKSRGHTFISCYDLQAQSAKPVSEAVAPSELLYEPHSLALDGKHLYVTYCGGRENGLAIFAWDELTGEIGECLHLNSESFDAYGHPKGVAIDAKTRKLFVSFTTEKPFPVSRSNWRQKLRRAWTGSDNVLHFMRKCLIEIRIIAERIGSSETPVNNGVMIFDLHKGFPDTPEKLLLSNEYNRFENIDVCRGLLAIADPLNNAIALFSPNDLSLTSPRLIISEHLTFPHDVAISPITEELVVANYGIETHEDEVMWHCFDEDRSDRMVFFTLTGQEAAC